MVPSTTTALFHDHTMSIPSRRNFLSANILPYLEIKSGSLRVPEMDRRSEANHDSQDFGSSNTIEDSNSSTDKSVLSPMVKRLKVLLSGLGHLTLVILTFSYHERMLDNTIRPIQLIALRANDPDRLLAALAYFRIKNQADIDFVRSAV